MFQASGTANGGRSDPSRQAGSGLSCQTLGLTMTHFVSPHFDHRKLQPPFDRDVIDVFEDRVRHWLLAPAKLLLAQPTNLGLVPAASIAVGYFEPIEIYMTGEDSDRRSSEFFCRGFRRVFQVEGQTEDVQKAIAKALYSALRCGFAHDGMPKQGINFSPTFQRPFLITWPKEAGFFVTTGKLESAIINPKLMVDGIERHFDAYIRDLRRGADAALVSNFKKAIAMKWALGEPGRFVATTEEQFLSGAL
jgi:hypothetical protein